MRNKNCIVETNSENDIFVVNPIFDQPGAVQRLINQKFQFDFLNLMEQIHLYKLYFPPREWNETQLLQPIELSYNKQDRILFNNQILHFLQRTNRTLRKHKVLLF